MSNIKAYNDKAGTFVLYLAQFSLGIDSLALLIYAKDRPNASVTISILLIWQVVVFIHFFRRFLPAYRTLDRANSEHITAYIHLFQMAQMLPAMIALVILTMIRI